MNREVHVQFFERAGVKLPCATHPIFHEKRAGRMVGRLLPQSADKLAHVER
jgi:hypothetical protein